jgi:hypothetical protein
MERRPREISNTGNEAMLYWIPMKVVQRSFEIIFIATRMLPKPTLPNGSLAMAKS